MYAVLTISSSVGSRAIATVNANVLIQSKVNKDSRQELGFLAVTIALFSFLGAGNEARIADEDDDDDDDVVEHDDDIDNDDVKNDYDYNEKNEL